MFRYIIILFMDKKSKFYLLFFFYTQTNIFLLKLYFGMDIIKVRNMKGYTKYIKVINMNIKYIEKDIKLTEAISNYIETKLERLNKYFDETLDVTVTLKEEGLMKVSEFNVKGNTKSYRSVTENQDLYQTFDKAIDILERLVRKENEKEIAKRNEVIDTFEDFEEEIEDEIIKYQTYEPKPMTPEDAKILLKEHRTNNFLTFINSENGQVNVIFKLKDKKNFGLVIPE